jgi:hypothetical protein
VCARGLVVAMVGRGRGWVGARGLGGGRREGAFLLVVGKAEKTEGLGLVALVMGGSVRECGMSELYEPE